ncbi:MAG: hypothetical protein GF346_12680 [Candidatus Eisenbacteria bacterium]|nr:hypothetical protein [Candidatus Latescibacterota bacterium]MBD3303292.1 hypothetical protein [Candidatus Eisenbacteria bacterium]
MNDPEPRAEREDELLPSTVRTLTIQADYFAGTIDLKRFRAVHPHYPVLRSDPLVLEAERGSFVVLMKFGGVVYWSCTDEVISQVREEVASLPGELRRVDRVSDRVEIQIGAAKEEVEFDRIYLREFTPEKLKIVSLALAQSVALESFEIRVNEVLTNSEPFVARLVEKGKLRRRERQVIQAVGFALQVRSAVLANLTLFDDPPETWESEALAHLDAKLYDHFDLEERTAAIKEKVLYLQDLNQTLLDVLSNRKARRLEWIIIILIFVEIVFFVWMEVLR